MNPSNKEKSDPPQAGVRNAKPSPVMSRKFEHEYDSSAYKTTPKRKMSFDERIDSSIEHLKKAEQPEDWARLLHKSIEEILKQNGNPQRLVKYAISAKSKSFFEDSISQETSESLIWVVSDAIKKGGVSTSNQFMLFKFLSGQNYGTPAHHNRTLLEKLITTVCLPALGRFPSQDRFILLLLHKILFKLTDEVKSLRPQITHSTVNGVLLYFSLLLEQPSRRGNSEYLKVYNDYLRIAELFPRELLDLKAIKTTKYVTEETYGHLDCLIEVCVLNMSLGSGSALEEMIWSPNYPSLSKLLKQPEFTARVEQISRMEKPTSSWMHSASQTQSSCVSTSETQMDTQNTEAVEQAEKLKITSARFISTMLRNIPKLFIDHKLWSRILPTVNLVLPKKELLPKMVFTADLVQNIYSKWRHIPVTDATIQLALPLLGRISQRIHSSMDRSLEEQNLVTLTNLKTKLLADLRAKDSQLSLVYFWLTERNPKVRDACLECIGLFLAHQPIENYFLKIEAKSKAAQKAPTAQSTAIAKGLRSLGQLLYLELMLDQLIVSSKEESPGELHIHCLQRLQKLFSLGEDLGLDPMYRKTLIELYLVPTVLLYSPNGSHAAYSQFEGALLTLETFIRKDPSIVTGALKEMLSMNLNSQLTSCLSTSEAQTAFTEDRIGLIVGFARILYAGDHSLLLRQLQPFQDSLVAIVGKAQFENAKSQATRVLTSLMDSMVDCSTLVSKEKWSRSSSVCVMKDRKAQDTDLIPNRKPRSISPNTETNTGGATSREVINLKIKRFVGVVLQT